MSAMVEAYPSYLRSPGNNERRYGKLKYEERTKSWVVEGEPCVVELAKRLFPGCQGRGMGIARFKANKRTNGDLNWLMLRYPLDIEEPELWEQTRTKAIEHVMHRERILVQPQRVAPASFKSELKPFQEEGLAFLLHNRRSLLADDMGLGKTVQALAFLSTAQTYPALIVVQPHLITNWKNEIGRFIIPPSRTDGAIPLFQDEVDETALHIIRGKKPYELPPASIYIIHYGLLASWVDDLEELGLQAIVFDEIQDLRHSGTLKYSAASKLSDAVENVIGLSGTPIYNRGGEMWNVMNIIEFHCLGDWESFTREWCNGYGNDTVLNPDLLGDYLRREGLLLRRRKTDVLDQLPPKRRLVHQIDSDEREFSTLIRKAMEMVDTLDTVTDHREKWRMYKYIENEARQATGIAKAPYVAEFVAALVEAGERVILSAYHHRVFDLYMEHLVKYNPVCVTGRENEKEKAESVRRFMEGESNIIILSLRTAAGLNLQRANVVVFGELDWSPAVHSQVEDRAHRMGQLDSVLAYYLVSKSGSDEDMQEALGLKISQFVGLMGDSPESDDEQMLASVAAGQHIEKIVERLKTRSKRRA